VPFLVLACYIPKPQAIDVGPASFTVLRTLTVVALARIALRGDWRGVSLAAVDYLMLCWGLLMVCTVALHRDPTTQVIGRLGLALDGLGLYVVFRLFCRSLEDVKFLSVALGLVLAPLAASMVYEKISSHNLLSVFGSPEASQIRDGRSRARGPFRHAILAGTIGAFSVPFMVGLWRTHRAVAALGLTACVCIVVASNSSGPLMSLATALFALALWPFRERLHIARWAAVGLYLLLAVVMTRPPYYLMARIDLTGSSTGWHRARLIESSIAHLNEWWLAGTDYTRHWMPTGVSWSPDHTDLTNHFIALGVYGGLPLLLTFLAVMAVCFRRVGRQLATDRTRRAAPSIPWALGSVLFTIAVTSVSISYFDQSILWLYMTIAFCGVLSGEPAVAVIAQARTSAAAIVASHRAGRRRRTRAQPAAATGTILPTTGSALRRHP
jgi:hypothetical protein